MEKTSIDTVLEAVTLSTGVSKEALLGNYRGRKVTDARRIASNILCKQGYKLQQIGKVLNRHHATIIYQRDTSEIMLRQSDDYFNLYKKTYNILY